MELEDSLTKKERRKTPLAMAEFQNSWDSNVKVQCIIRRTLVGWKDSCYAENPV